MSAAAAGYTPPTGAVNVLIDVDPSQYADVDSVVDVSGNVSGTWTKSGSPTLTTVSGKAALVHTGVQQHTAPVLAAGNSRGKTLYVACEIAGNTGVCGFDNGSGVVLGFYSVSTDFRGINRDGVNDRDVNVTQAFSASTTYVLAVSVSDAGATSLYLDGSQLGSTTSTGGPTIDFTAVPFRLGFLPSLVGCNSSIFRVIVDQGAFSATLSSTLAAAYA